MTAGNRSIDVVALKADLEQIMEKYGLAPESLELVDSLENEPNPNRASRCFKIEKKIQIKKVITLEDRLDTLKLLSKFDQADLKKIEGDEQFVKHLLMKHICSINERWKDLHECDKWAFYNLKFV
ncbi:MAG: hypothetical protein AABY51_06510 [Deltaproteobacteria bacterium]